MAPCPLVILIPVFDDWDVLRLLIPDLDMALEANGLSAEVVLVDDASPQRPPDDLAPAMLRAIHGMEALHLRTQMGHQRAIAIGLVHLWQTRGPSSVVVMDADGEDSPTDVPRLVERLRQPGTHLAVFAQRSKRAEGWVFRLHYLVYRMLHRTLTGRPGRIGNFSILSWPAVERLTVTPEAWNHYSAAVVRSKMPFVTVPIGRAKRRLGHSRMGLTGLITHGLSSISVFADTVGVRMLVASSIVGGMALMALAAGFQLAGVVLACAVVTGLAALALTLAILSGRSRAPFLPDRDCPAFLAEVTTLALRKSDAARSSRR